MNGTGWRIKLCFQNYALDWESHETLAGFMGFIGFDVDLAGRSNGFEPGNFAFTVDCSDGIL